MSQDQIGWKGNKQLVQEESINYKFIGDRKFIYTNIIIQCVAWRAQTMKKLFISNNAMRIVT
jgi:hypothetical protein